MTDFKSIKTSIRNTHELEDSVYLSIWYDLNREMSTK